NALDPARLDPQNPPPSPWTLQATYPQFFADLSEWFRWNDYDLRALMSAIVKSNAYQLSSSYPGEWKPEYVPFYARHYIRRLDAEEIHDAVVKATGIQPIYSLGVQGGTSSLPSVNWAMQLPDTGDVTIQGNAAADAIRFLDAFGRGDRDLTPRSSG